MVGYFFLLQTSISPSNKEIACSTMYLIGKFVSSFRRRIALYAFAETLIALSLFFIIESIAERRPMSTIIYFPQRFILTSFFFENILTIVIHLNAIILLPYVIQSQTVPKRYY